MIFWLGLCWLLLSVSVSAFQRQKQCAEDLQEDIGPAETGGVDLVYLWVNSSDPGYAQQRKHTLLRMMTGNDRTSFTNRWSPTIDHGELLLSLRSIELNMPYIRKIWIITNNQNIDWLEPSGKVNVVDGYELIREAGGTVPNFNTHAFYLVMHRIPGLSEIFLQADDDFMLMNPNKLGLFVNDTKLVHYYENPVGVGRRGEYAAPVPRSLCHKMNSSHDLNKCNVTYWEAHTLRPYRKSDMKEIWQAFPSECTATVNHAFRHREDLILPAIYPIFMMAMHPISFHHQKLPADGAQFVSAISCGHVQEHMKQLKARGVYIVAVQDSPWTRGRHGCTETQKRTSFQQIEQDFFPLPGPHERQHASLQLNFSRLLNETNLAIGHRGVGLVPGLVLPNASFAFPPENTLESLQALAALGVMGSEVDISILGDGTVILHHTDRGVFGERCQDPLMKHFAFKHMTKDMLGLARYGGTSVPTLKEVLEYAKKVGMSLSIELKQGTNYGRTKACISAMTKNIESKDCKVYSSDALVEGLLSTLQEVNFHRDAVQVSSFDASRLRYFLQRAKGAYVHTKLVLDTVLQTPDPDFARVVFAAVRLWGINSISIVKAHTSQEVVQLAQREFGLAVELGLPSKGSSGFCIHEQDPKVAQGITEQDVNEALAVGANMICGDRPDLVVRTRTKLQHASWSARLPAD
eukprot:gnl/TRDRNA2_/TRDRNA2_176868_c0_seq1.p1 gnl/TRDRNA2_/TRDRNA2_176868_c0~~gnl/TRDRNA2_/TRDRNA2_176868_c0_seq1.p1  ORF type:complete len:691 (-),score=57.96 gnl/TRDRNA2_/TRDRNA2_176868_c0_seq1:39-2111(-)